MSADELQLIFVSNKFITKKLDTNLLESYNDSWNFLLINLSEIKMENNYEKYEHSVGKIMLHLEWCTKYRYKMFLKFEYKSLVTACIRRAASLHGIEIIELNVQREHVHCRCGI